ncbi:HupE/UreJ family protein [Yoonia sp. R2331]|uniref:HupE/UreJ family protein n=1 Tax=Yoonia sp. R2331 TaxID=3237238 RepID=UPI0034E61B26
MSSAMLVWITLASSAQAHEVLPTIADMRKEGDSLVFDMRLSMESFIAGIDQDSVLDTDATPQAADYDRLRALEPAELQAAFAAFWPQMAARISVTADDVPLDLTLVEALAGDVGDVDLARASAIRVAAALPQGAETVSFAWDRSFGTMVLRQVDVPAPYDGYLQSGAATGPIPLAGGAQLGPMQTFVNYIPVGFDHIVPLGLDHILFVLGLFFLSTRMGPLLWQVSAFTLAHTITLALAALGYVTVPGSIVEPLIALSIVYVAVENLFTDGLSRWRPFIIFGFGLLHGLGFASVLAEFGLPEGTFVPALIGFNIGVEIGQLAVIGVAYVCVMKAIDHSDAGTESRTAAAVYLALMVAVIALIIPISGMAPDLVAAMVPLIATVAILLGLSAASVVVGRFDSYRQMVAMPGSILIAVVAAYWCVERVFL